MSNETVFYILGGCLVALALITSFVGLRWERFPTSKGMLAGVVAIFVLLVGATATLAWRNGEDEQEHRNAEIAAGELPSPQEALLAEGEAVQEPTSEEAGESQSGQTTTPTEETASADGAQLFADQGCSGCHTLTAADATGTTGPNLDESLKGKDPAYIEEGIVNPNEQLADGFPPNVMPQSFGETLSPEELDALVQYLSESTSG
jgi:mono/diheme cytochrome c family protein